jgi:hypothetical protein
MTLQVSEPYNTPLPHLQATLASSELTHSLSCSRWPMACAIIETSLSIQAIAPLDSHAWAELSHGTRSSLSSPYHLHSSVLCASTPHEHLAGIPLASSPQVDHPPPNSASRPRPRLAFLHKLVQFSLLSLSTSSWPFSPHAAANQRAPLTWQGTDRLHVDKHVMPLSPLTRPTPTPSQKTAHQDPTPLFPSVLGPGKSMAVAMSMTRIGCRPSLKFSISLLRFTSHSCS